MLQIRAISFSTIRHDALSELLANLAHNDGMLALFNRSSTVDINEVDELLVLQELIGLLVELGCCLVDFRRIVEGLGVDKDALDVLPEVLGAHLVLFGVPDLALDQ